jgi:hypothetical protein
MRFFFANFRRLRASKQHSLSPAVYSLRLTRVPVCFHDNNFRSAVGEFLSGDSLLKALQMRDNVVAESRCFDAACVTLDANELCQSGWRQSRSFRRVNETRVTKEPLDFCRPSRNAQVHADKGAHLQSRGNMSTSCARIELKKLRGGEKTGANLISQKK